MGEEGLFNKSRGGGHGLLKTTPYATIRVEYDWREQFDFNRGGGVKIALWTLLWEDSVLLRVLINSGSNMIFPFFFPLTAVICLTLSAMLSPFASMDVWMNWMNTVLRLHDHSFKAWRLSGREHHCIYGSIFAFASLPQSPALGA